MSETALLELWRGALWCAVYVAAPFVIVALLVGLIASLLQAATQLQENALSFIPKLIAVGVVLALGGPWFLHQLTQYTHAAGERMVDIGLGRRP